VTEIKKGAQANITADAKRLTTVAERPSGYSSLLRCVSESSNVFKKLQIFQQLDVLQIPLDLLRSVEVSQTFHSRHLENNLHIMRLVPWRFSTKHRFTEGARKSLLSQMVGLSLMFFKLWVFGLAPAYSYYITFIKG
jgi:hypothetical protein